MWVSGTVVTGICQTNQDLEKNESNGEEISEPRNEPSRTENQENLLTVRNQRDHI